jgi:hypothetical protein
MAGAPARLQQGKFPFVFYDLYLILIAVTSNRAQRTKDRREWPPRCGKWRALAVGGHLGKVSFVSCNLYVNLTVATNRVQRTKDRRE